MYDETRAVLKDRLKLVCANTIQRDKSLSGTLDPRSRREGRGEQEWEDRDDHGRRLCAQEVYKEPNLRKL